MKESWLVRIDSDPPARIAATVNPRRIPADHVESEDGALYLGGAALLNIPELQALINDIADRISITISGVSAAAMAMAVEESPAIKGCDLHIGRVSFDDAWQVESVTWLRTYRIDKITTDRGQGQNGATRTITLSLGSDNTGRSSAPNAFFTAVDQARRSPTDKFFDHVANMQNAARRFGLRDD